MTTLADYLGTMSQEEKAILRLQGACEVCYHTDNRHHDQCTQRPNGSWYAPYIPLNRTNQE